MNILHNKTNLHPKNKHRNGYNFEKLIDSNADLKKYVFTNKYNTQTIDFSNPNAVKELNRAILYLDYDVEFWDIPENYLCPPIPGRADYLHNLSDLLESKNKIIKANNITVLDIGVGSNCIYPILGNFIYKWHFVGTDIDENALQNCKKILEKNPKLTDAISLQLQIDPRSIFKNIILPDDKFTFTICNPPFHDSKEVAKKTALRKVSALQDKKVKNTVLNFGGQDSELWCDGGEIAFITQMIYESVKYANRVFWFTTLVSKKDNLARICKLLEKVSVADFKLVDMSQGNKTSRIVAWTFLTEQQQQKWFEK